MKNYILLYIIFCIIGAGLEWAYGTFWGMVGTTPWIYPNSTMRYTSLEGIPLWGFGGLITISVYKSVIQKEARLLVGTITPLLLAILWILVYVNVWG